MKAVVFTLGCKVNECESDSLIAGLIERGYEVSDKLEYADLYIVNTCAVTSEAEKKSRQTASRIKKLNNSAKIIFTGCAVQKNPTAFSEKDGNFLVTGVFSKQKILDMLDWSGEHISSETKVFEELLVTNSLRTRAYVKVQDGCNNFCSYCIIPYLRGRSRSRSPQSILDELNAIKPKEAVINGINLSAFNFEGVDLKGLMDILKDVPTRIRLGSLEARVITEEFLISLKNLFDFAPHFHLSLQSGSDLVLKSMNRRYTTEEYFNKVQLIREYFPNAGITTDVIVGFPTETEEEFNNSLEFVKKVEFSDVHAFPFSPRSGTNAFEMKDLSPEIKKERLNKLLKVKGELKEKFAKKMNGQVLEMLTEEVKDGYLEGYSENYLRLYLKDEIPNSKMIKVKVCEPFKDGALAIKI